MKRDDIWAVGFVIAAVLLAAAFVMAILAVWDVGSHQDEWGGTAVLVGALGVVLGGLAVMNTDDEATQ